MPDSISAVAIRIAQTRKALGYRSQADFCREIGVDRNIYNPFEKAKRRMTIDVALKIRARFGISLDWIYCGDPAQLPAGLFQKLTSGRRSAA